MPEVDSFWWRNPYAIISFGDVQQRTTTKKDTKEPLWEEDFVFPLSNGATSAATALDVLVCTTDGQDQDQLVGTTQVSVPRSPDENFELDNFPLIDGHGRRRGACAKA